MWKWWRRRRARKIAAKIAILQEHYAKAKARHARRSHLAREILRLRAEQLRLEA